MTRETKLTTARYPVYIFFLTYYPEAHSAQIGDGSDYQTFRDWRSLQLQKFQALCSACISFESLFWVVAEQLL